MALITLIVAALLVPFANRAFFVDDIYHYTIAKQLLGHPMRPYDFNADEISGNKEGWVRGKIPWLLNPPLMHYLVALIISLVGENLKVIRILFIVFPILSAIFMYLLAKEFQVDPLYCVLLMISTPAFLVTSTGMLIDAVLLTFCLAAVFFFIRGYNSNNIILMMISSVILGLSLLVKYTAFAIVILLLCWFIYKFREKNNFGLISLYFIIPFLIFVLWSVWNYIGYGGFHVVEAMKDGLIKTGPFWSKIIVFATFYCGCLIFPVFSLYFLIIRKKWSVLLAAVLFSIMMSAVFSSSLGGFTLLQSVHISLLLTVSVLYFCLAAESLFMTGQAEYLERKLRDECAGSHPPAGFAKQNKGGNIIDTLGVSPGRFIYSSEANIFFVLWMIIASIVISKSIMWMAARYLLLILPPSIIFFVNMSEKLIGGKKYAGLLKYSVLVITFIFGISVTYADYLQAEFNRSIAKDLSKDISEFNNRSVYFIGNSFLGLHYYLGKIGLKTYYQDTVLKEGDLILLSEMRSQPIDMRLYPKLIEKFDKMTLSRAYIYKTGFPIHVMDKQASAGLYSSFLGTLPYAISARPVEIFYLYEYEKGKR